MTVSTDGDTITAPGATGQVVATTPGNGLTSDQSSAQGILNSFFSIVGLTSLSDWAWQKYLHGDSINEIMLEARQTKEYQARYPAMAQLDKEGRGISEAAYQSYEENVRSLAQQYGLPKGMYDTPDQIANMLIKGVSINEATARAQLAASAAYTAPQSTRDAMAKLWGVDSGGLIGMYLDSSKALPLLQTQFQAAQVAGAGLEQGVGINADLATSLAQKGVSYDQAKQGFGQVAGSAGLAAGAGETADLDTRIAAAFGDAQAQQTVQRVVKGRLGQFSAGGGAAQGQTGVAGLGVGSA